MSYSSVLVILLLGFAAINAAPFRFTTTNEVCSRFVQWNRLIIPGNVTAPSPRFDSAVAVDPRSQTFYVHGGAATWTPNNQLYSFDQDNSEWLDVTNENPMAGVRDHTVNYYNGSLLIFGGKTDSANAVNDLYKYNIDAATWEGLETNAPAGRYGHSAAVHNGSLFVFGGRFINDTATNELWSLNLTSLEWTQHESTETPSPRLWHTTVLLNNKWILYGGYTGASGLADVWSFDFETLQWTMVSETSPLDPRSGHVAVVLEGEMFVVAGEVDVGPIILQNNDVWSFNPSTSAWTQWCSVGTSLPARLGHRADVVTIEGTTGALIFGGITTDLGFNNGWFYNDLWAMNVVPQQAEPIAAPVGPAAPTAVPAAGPSSAPTHSPHACPSSDSTILTPVIAVFALAVTLLF